MNTPKFAWLNGKIVEWDNCLIHVRSQGAFWGANVFEGVRAYWNTNYSQLYIYKLEEHLLRLRDSMKCLDMNCKFSNEEIKKACIALLQANNFQEDIHIVISAYFGFGKNFDSLGLTEDVGLHITALPMPRSDKYFIGCHAAISSWRRISGDSMPPRIKAGANYHNSRIAQQEALRNGYDSAIFLNNRGTVSEAPGSCIAIYYKGVIVTPPSTSGVLESITIDVIQKLAKEELGINFEYREIDRTELYVAKEIFLCGTLVEIQPIITVDRKLISDGKPGVLTSKLQALYENMVRNNPSTKYSLPVY